MDENPYESPHDDVVASPLPIWRARFRRFFFCSLLVYVMSIIAAGAVAYSGSAEYDFISYVCGMVVGIIGLTSMVLICLSGIAWALSLRTAQSTESKLSR